MLYVMVVVNRTFGLSGDLRLEHILQRYHAQFHSLQRDLRAQSYLVIKWPIDKKLNVEI